MKENGHINKHSEAYSKGRIAKLIAEKNGWKLSEGEICLKIPDIKLNELMEWAAVCLDPNGSNDSNTDVFKSLQRGAVENWIDMASDVAPEIAARLFKELNPNENQE